MPLPDSAHLQRARAESFGSVAALYDRYRPAYPDQLLDVLVSRAGGSTVLDVGTGTGKAARQLADRGVDVLGVEIDPLMVEVARGHGLTVEIGSFEAWPDAGRRFTLITCAQAWHWVDPVAGAAKIGRLLTPGGTFAPFWNFEELADEAHAVAVEVYRQLAPELVPSDGRMRRVPDKRPYAEDLERSGVFASVDTRTYRWAGSYPVEHWVGRVGTHSDHLGLGPDRLAALQNELAQALLGIGPEVHTAGGTYLVLAEVAA